MFPLPITPDCRKKARARGKRFENKVQKFFEEQGWIVMRFTKKVEEGKLINCRPKWFKGRLLTFQSGFPDFLLLKLNPCEIRLCECKLNGYLNPKEKDQVKFLNSLGFKIDIAWQNDREIRLKPALADA